VHDKKYHCERCGFECCSKCKEYLEGRVVLSDDLVALRPRTKFNLATKQTVRLSGNGRNKGKFYHEVELGEDCKDPRLGWVTNKLVEGEKSYGGIGSDSEGWACDGVNNKWYHHGTEGHVEWPRKWCSHDVIGLAIDLDEGHMYFSLDGSWVRAAQFDFTHGGNDYFFPAVSSTGLWKMNITRARWRHKPPSEDFHGWAAHGEATKSFQQSKSIAKSAHKESAFVDTMQEEFKRDSDLQIQVMPRDQLEFRLQKEQEETVRLRELLRSHQIEWEDDPGITQMLNHIEGLAETAAREDETRQKLRTSVRLAAPVAMVKDLGEGDIQKV